MLCMADVHELLKATNKFKFLKLTCIKMIDSTLSVGQSS